MRPAYALNVAILDLNGDSRQDIFVGNDSMGNYLFSNQGGGRFREVGIESGVSANSDGASQATIFYEKIGRVTLHIGHTPGQAICSGHRKQWATR